jgi:hypothetical protein
MSTENLTLTPEELLAITGYKQPAAQLAALLARGFWLARRAPMTGRVILDRAHYQAVCAGADRGPAANGQHRQRPQLRAV